MSSSEEEAERVVEQVDEGGCIEVSIVHHLPGKERLPEATTEEASHHPTAHVHVMSYFLDPSLHGTNNCVLIAAAVKVLVEFSQENIQALKFFRK